MKFLYDFSYLPLGGVSEASNNRGQQCCCCHSCYLSYFLPLGGGSEAVRTIRRPVIIEANSAAASASSGARPTAREDTAKVRTYAFYCAYRLQFSATPFQPRRYTAVFHNIMFHRPNCQGCGSAFYLRIRIQLFFRWGSRCRSGSTALLTVKVVVDPDPHNGRPPGSEPGLMRQKTL